jgi:hypothetical protein
MCARASAVSATRGTVRVLRGAGLAVCCAALGVAGHAAAGGAVPAIGPTVLLTVLLAGAGIALADRQRGPLGIIATVGGTQVALHVLLDALTHDHGGAPATGDDPLAMVGLHAVAALVTGLALAGAERAVFGVVGALSWLLRRLVPVCTAVPGGEPPPSRPSTAAPGQVVVRLLLRRVHRRRGPPVLL